MHNVRVKDYGNGKKQITLYYDVICGHDYSKNEFKQNNDSINFDDLSQEEQDFFLACKENARLHSELNNYKRAKNKIYDYARSNMWTYFLTFTFNSEKVQRDNYDDCKNKLTKWLNNISQRHCSGQLKYLIVPELHKDGINYHFHGLLSNCDGIIFEPSGLTDRTGRTIYNLPQYKLGFSTATKISSVEKVCGYIAKYVTKQLDLKLKGKRRYLISSNLNEPNEEKYYINQNLDEFADSIPNVLWEELKEYKVCGENRKMKIIEIDENLESI